MTSELGLTNRSGKRAAAVAPQGVTAIETFDFSQFLNDDTRRDLVFVAELWQGERRLAVQTAFFIPTKHLSLADPQIQAETAQRDGLLRIELSARSLARLVEVSLAGTDVVFSDNYFDLPAGRSVTITCPLPTGWTLGQAQAALKVRSVYDSYAK